MKEPIHIISLGAGVQSTTMALMAAHKELTPMPKAAIFSDTGGEPNEVYRHLDWLENQLPFPVHRVKHKDGLTKTIERSVKEGSRLATPPFFTDKNGKTGLLRRQCTAEFKIIPIEKQIRVVLGLKKYQRIKDERCVQWIGISYDEMTRMKLNRNKHIENIFPLVDLKMRREDCLSWMREKGYPEPPRSACVYCPYHSNEEWLHVQKDPEAWEEAKRIDRLIRNGTAKITSQLFLHRSLTPIDEVDFHKTAKDKDGVTFQDECEGMCGN